MIETIKEYNKPQLVLNVAQPRSKLQSVDLTSTTPGADVEVKLNGKVIGTGKIKSTRVGNIILDGELKKGNFLVITISYKDYLSRTDTQSVR